MNVCGGELNVQLSQQWEILPKTPGYLASILRANWFDVKFLRSCFKLSQKDMKTVGEFLLSFGKDLASLLISFVGFNFYSLRYV